MDVPLNSPSGVSSSRVITPGTLFMAVGVFALIAVIGMQMIRRNAGPLTQGPAPDFSIELYSGDTFTLAEQRGKFVVVNFWGSWCMGCREEASELQSAWEKYRGSGVSVIGVSFRDEEASARKFLDEFALTFPTGSDTSLNITAAYGITGAPQTYIVGPDGSVVDFALGQFQPGWLDQTLERLLAGDPAS